MCCNVCRMRWTVRGIPRVPWNAEGVFDGVSTFRLDRKGMIYEHQASTPLAYAYPTFTGVSPVRCWSLLHQGTLFSLLCLSALHVHSMLYQWLSGRWKF